MNKFDTFHDKNIRALLFDLDGTLANTLPDITAALNQVRKNHGQHSVQQDWVHPFIAQGSKGLLNAAIDAGGMPVDSKQLKEEFFAYYRQSAFSGTHLFAGIPQMLSQLEQKNIPWGIVTNQLTHLAQPLLQHLGLSQKIQCLVGADTTPYLKPHPAPLLYAAECLQIQPQAIVYVGDSFSDIQAGKAAGMMTIIAAYGYHTHNTHFSDWQADAIVYHPEELAALWHLS